MNLRLTAVIAVTAVLSSVLSVGVSRLSVTSPAQASPRAVEPTDTQLLTEIADNTATANGKLHVLGQDLQALQAEENKIYSINYLGAKRLRYINTNLVGLYKQFKSTFAYRKPPHSKYTVNEMTLIEATLCSMDLWLQDEVLDNTQPQLPPCGGR